MSWLPGLKKRMNWFLENRCPDRTWQIRKVYFCNSAVCYYSMKCAARGRGERFLLALTSKGRLLEKMPDESEFLE
ncbi:hypothetical protein EDB87DRAFT_1647926 [Lactarius vividus]|nr:hypothetical protein EDB87DRAFT_1647926 [Lactarius vividus]